MSVFWPGEGGQFEYLVGVVLSIAGGGVIIWQSFCDVAVLGWSVHLNIQVSLVYGCQELA